MLFLSKVHKINEILTEISVSCLLKMLTCKCNDYYHYSYYKVLLCNHENISDKKIVEIYNFGPHPIIGYRVGSSVVNKRTCRSINISF